VRPTTIPNETTMRWPPTVIRESLIQLSRHVKERMKDRMHEPRTGTSSYLSIKAEWMDRWMERRLIDMRRRTSSFPSPSFPHPHFPPIFFPYTKAFIQTAASPAGEINTYPPMYHSLPHTIPSCQSDMKPSKAHAPHIKLLSLKLCHSGNRVTRVYAVRT
jgi:hypothetical protein